VGATETLTIFHRDGAALLATHSCAQGNQPRLSLTEVRTPGLLVFEFRDATNLAQASDSHLARLTLDLRDPKVLVMAETSVEQGAPGTTTLQFSRL
jgi:hypothetical protein